MYYTCILYGIRSREINMYSAIRLRNERHRKMSRDLRFFFVPHLSTSYYSNIFISINIKGRANIYLFIHTNPL